MAKKRHKPHHEEEHENEERWLVSFADMMTLLFCLFMVLFAISSVNTSKFEALQRSLKDAFSGAVLDGGKSMLSSGSDQDKTKQSAVEPPLPSLRPLTAINNTSRERNVAQEEKDAKQEEQDFRALKRRVDKLAKDAGVAGKVNVTVRRRGLVIQLLTDKVFFSSGDATLHPEAHKLVAKIGQIVRDERKHPVVVEGYTDSQPIANSRFASNWDLSGARAAAVVNDFAEIGVLSARMSLQGYGSQVPVDTNSTADGRAKNRRVEIVLSRIHSSNTDTESTP
ncbi:flagellar motor protein MotB [Solirubrobacter soli]|uniref:flagellar motor protein MotB n=1 Tax=Solirubrobacter soli TaxID=363832 RepID=UPI0003F99EB6|nr:flagellar motor protein MotB [Solirubrobacter soli]